MLEGYFFVEKSDIIAYDKRDIKRNREVKF